MKFTKRDFYFCLATGLITGFSTWRIFNFLKIPVFFGVPHVWLMVIVPFLWIIGVNFGYFLGQRLNFFNQFGRFAAIGFTNAAVDFVILNLLIAGTGIASGIYYSVFKTISFICAVIPSYFWNKYWAFKSGGQGGVGVMEFSKFFSVMIVSILINNGVASFVVNYIHPLLGFNPQRWANVGGIVGSAAALIFSFIGFKLAVFRK